MDFGNHVVGIRPVWRASNSNCSLFFSFSLSLHRWGHCSCGLLPSVLGAQVTLSYSRPQEARRRQASHSKTETCPQTLIVPSCPSMVKGLRHPRNRRDERDVGVSTAHRAQHSPCLLRDRHGSRATEENKGDEGTSAGSSKHFSLVGTNRRARNR